MFAVIKTGGKQYRVTADDVLKIGKLDGQAGDMIEFGEVLVHGEGENATFGSPLVDGARVTAEVVEQGRARTVIAFKKRRRQNSRRKRGQRQHETTVRILEILASGQTASRKPQPAASTADVTSEGAKGTVDVTASTDMALENQAPAATAKEPKAAKPRASKEASKAEGTQSADSSDGAENN